MHSPHCSTSLYCALAAWLGITPLYAATLHVPADHPSIQAAINAAKAGDVVRVRPGRYPETIRLKAGVVLRSAGSDEAGDTGLIRAEQTLLDAGGEAPAVVMAEQSVLDGFTVLGAGHFDAAQFDRHHAERGVNLPDDQGVVGRPGSTAAILLENVSATVTGCIVRDNGHPGIAIAGSSNRSTIRGNTVFRNMGAGIGVALGAQPLVSKNESHHNLRAGIGCRKASPRIEDNRCHHNVRAGIGIREGATPRVLGNLCYENRRAGIGVRMPGTAPQLSGNKCHHNGLAGIGCRDGAAPVIFNNECYANERAGIGAMSNARPLIVGNRLHDNEAAAIGLSACESGEALIRGNDIAGRSVVCLGIQKGWRVRVEDNRIVRQGGLPPLVMVFAGARAEFTENTFVGSGVAAIRTEGQTFVAHNAFHCPAPRQGGPPQTAVWSLPGAATAMTEDNINEGWRWEPAPARRVSSRSDLLKALREAQPGTTILVEPGEYEGGLTASPQGEPGRPIVIAAARFDQKPVFTGGTTALHLRNAIHVELRGLAIRHARGNGLNIDDGGRWDSPARDITLSRLDIQDIGPQGNRDGIKLSGVRAFRVEQCQIERWGEGGSGVDMVGCHDGMIADSFFSHPGAEGANGIQAKGGSSRVSIRRCRFEKAGGRSINLGGSTGADYFRPPNAAHEAHDLLVEDCTFLGSSAPVAFVGVDGAMVQHNTLYRPARWILRILQENRDPRLVPCRNGQFHRNVVVFDSRELRTAVNIGPDTAPGTFRFEGNVWHALDRPAETRRLVQLPGKESGGTYGSDPRFRNATEADLRMAKQAWNAGVREGLSWTAFQEHEPGMDQGRAARRDTAPDSDGSWWAYRPLQVSALGSIDAHVEKSLAEKGLTMNPPANRRTLIRRATYDLTGLPPTPQEVEAFVQDTDPRAFETLIDRLLASPHYGERWGRHWLDVVRFGESVGFEQNWIINDAWPFRDYVIRSFNEDKPFDQMIREHLAGDVIGQGDPNTAIATAFLVAGPHDTVGNQDAAQTAQIRANTLDEIINACGEAFLGMTLGCARCHDHKFDPISQRDYYRLYATFAGVRHGSVPWATPQAKKERAARVEPLQQRKAAIEAELKKLDAHILKRAKASLDQYEKHWTRPAVDRTGTEETFEPVTARYVRLVCEAQDLNPRSPSGFRIDEFEVWSAEPTPRNVALASLGGVASGPARQIEDFPGAYGAQHVNDGKVGTRFIATSNQLTIEWPEPTPVNRVFFSSARGEQAPELFKFVFVADYRIETSLDGRNWQVVAHGRDRRPVAKKEGNPANPAPHAAPSHLDHRLLQLAITEEEQNRKAGLHRDLAGVKRSLAEVPALPTAWMGRRSDKDAAGPFHVFLGGNPQKTGPEVRPASLSALEDVLSGYQLPSDAPESQRRLALARWITARDNPLTPRVLANRLWHYHFGTGLVSTPNDFGRMGGRPTHPELLDFLARKLQDHGWRLKAMHRLIMTSRAYRQSSAWRRKASAVDTGSRLLWRFPPRRLSAEEIRDTMLFVSGQLDTRMGGAGFRLYHYMRDNVATYKPLDEFGAETYRRSVYHQNARASVVDLLTDFDQADCTLSTPRRTHTTSPLQALTMLNHRFTLDMAESLAARLRHQAPGDPAAQFREAFLLAYQRPPDPDEAQGARQLVDTHGLRALGRVLFNSNEFIHLD